MGVIFMTENNSNGHKNMVTYTTGKITYIVESRSSDNATQTLKEKINSLIEKDAVKKAY